MSNESDFIIENGVLNKYVGPGGDVVIPEGVTSIGGGVFNECSSLTNITIPDSVTSIGSYAFNGCSSLTNIMIPDSVTSIGSYTFSDCSALKSITLPDNMTNIGYGTFTGCKKLADEQGFIVIKNTLFEYIGPGGKVVIPDGVTKIGNDVFEEYMFDRISRMPKKRKRLKSVTIPDSVTEIGSNAFQECSALTELTIPDSVTAIGNSAFDQCGLKRVILSEGLQTIGLRAFEQCRDLKKIILPSSVKSIGNHAFNMCSGLVSVEIPGTLKSFGEGVFNNCPELNGVFAPNNRLSMLTKGNSGLGLKAAATFCKRYAEYTDPEINAEYVNFISTQRKKMLPEIYRDDNVKMLEMLAKAGKIKKNQRDDYLLPALQCNAEKCVAYLKTVFGENSQEKRKTQRKRYISCNERSAYGSS